MNPEPELQNRVASLERDQRQLALRLARLESQLERAGLLQADGSLRNRTDPAPAPSVAGSTPNLLRPEPASRPVSLAGSALPPPLPDHGTPSRGGPVPAPFPVQAAPIASPPTAAPAPEPEPRPSGPTLADRLRSWGLLPPQDSNREVALGAWWTTRLAGLLGALTAVFFAVYVSFSTPPWVRWLELLGLSVAVSLAGLRLERTSAKTGRMLLGLGLALIHFTAVAGYAIPAVRIFESVTSAATAQAASILLMLTVAMRRDRPGLAGTAVALGVVAAGWARASGAPQLGWGALVALLAVGLSLRRLRGWNFPMLVSLPAAYIGVAMDADRLGSLTTALAVVGGMWLAAWVTDFLAARAGQGRLLSSRLLLNVNGALAVLAGSAVLLRWDLAGSLGTFLAASGGVYLAAAAAHRFAVPDRTGFAPLFLKASSLLLLGTILLLDGPSRVFGLLAQAILWHAAALRERSKLLDAASLGAAVLSTLSFGAQLYEGLAPLWGAGWLASATAFALWKMDTRGGAAERAGAWAAGFVLVTAQAAWLLLSLEPRLRVWGALGVSLAAGLCFRRLGSRIAVILAAGSWLSGGCLVLLGGVHAGIWAPLPGLTLATLALGAGLVWKDREPQPIGTLLHGAAALLLGVELGRSLGIPEGLVVCAALGGVAVWSSRILGAFRGSLQTLGLCLAASSLLAILPEFRPGGAPGWTYALIASICSLQLAPAWLLRFRISGNPWGDGAVADQRESLHLGVILCGALVLVASHAGVISLPMLASLAAGGLVVAGVGARLRVSGAREAALLLLTALAGLQIPWSLLRAPGYPVLAVGLATALVLLVSTATSDRWGVFAGPVRKRIIQAGALLGAVTAVMAIARIESGAVRWITALWGVGGMLFFSGGLVLRFRSWRVVGLGILALATARLFWSDINSMLGRIYAFGALAILLFAVGHLYHRFRGRIGADADA